MENEAWEESNIPERTTAAAWRTISEQVIVVHIDSAKVMGLNGVAGLIWSLIDGETTVGDIAVRIGEEFQVDKRTAMTDTLDFFVQLEQGGLISKKK